MELNTAEKFLLLAQHPEKGMLNTPEIYVKYGIVGAMLLDLSVSEKLSVENDRLIIKSSKGINDPILKDIVSKIESARKPLRIRTWINRFARRSSKIKLSVFEQLEKKKLIRIEHRKFLGLIPYLKTYLVETKTRNSLIKTLRNNILFEGDFNEENIGVLGLVEACKMHKIIANDRAEKKIIKKRLKETLKSSPIAKVVDSTIKQIQAAIMGAVIASTTAATTASSN